MRNYWLVVVAPRWRNGQYYARVVSRHLTRDTAEERAPHGTFVLNCAADVGDLVYVPRFTLRDAGYHV